MPSSPDTPSGVRRFRFPASLRWANRVLALVLVTATIGGSLVLATFIANVDARLTDAAWLFGMQFAIGLRNSLVVASVVQVALLLFLTALLLHGRPWSCVISLDDVGIAKTRGRSERRIAWSEIDRIDVPRWALGEVRIRGGGRVIRVGWRLVEDGIPGWREGRRRFVAALRERRADAIRVRTLPGIVAVILASAFVAALLGVRVALQSRSNPLQLWDEAQRKILECQWREARELTDRLVLDFPGLGLAHGSRAHALAGQGHLDAALDEIRLANELDPWPFFGSDLESAILELRGDFHGAAKAKLHEWPADRRLLVGSRRPVIAVRGALAVRRRMLARVHAACPIAEERR